MKAPAFQFYVGDYMQDTRMISLAARGAWMDLLCRMWTAQNRGQVTSSVVGYARLFGCTVEQAQTVIDELLDSDVCETVTERDGKVTLINRRMFREAKEREGANLRQERYRERLRLNGDGKSDGAGDAEITPPSSSSSSPSSSSSKAEEASREKKPRALPKLPDDEYLDELQKRKPYLLVNVRNVFEKMEVWCETKGVQPTRKRLLNWLNTEQRPMASTNGNKAPPVDDDCRDCRNTGLLTVADPANGYENKQIRCRCEYGTRRPTDLQTNRARDDDHRAA